MNQIFPFQNTIKVPLTCIGITLLMGFSESHKEMPERPNVLIIYTDQHSKQVMGFENHPDVITPNLDKLANESLVFDRAYCNVGICAPSRTSMMTGMYPRTLGLLNNTGRTQVMKDVVSLATVFRYNGYNTYAWGKRHTYLGADLGWDHHKSHLCHETPGDNYVTWIEAQGLGDELTYDWAAEFGRGPNCLVTLVDLFPTLTDLLGLELPEMKHQPQGYSFAGLITGEPSYKQEFVVSESWSQATVITKDHKLGIWLDPGENRSNFDYRNFGDMFFVRSEDPLEINNQIRNPAFGDTIKELRALYDVFTDRIPDTGKMELFKSR